MFWKKKWNFVLNTDLLQFELCLVPNLYLKLTFKIVIYIRTRYKCLSQLGFEEKGSYLEENSGFVQAISNKIQPTNLQNQVEKIFLWKALEMNLGNFLVQLLNISLCVAGSTISSNCKPLIDFLEIAKFLQIINLNLFGNFSDNWWRLCWSLRKSRKILNKFVHFTYENLIIVYIGQKKKTTTKIQFH